MKTLILLILLGAVFLSGYYLGQRPNSPDVFGWTQKFCQRVTDAGREAAQAINALGTDAPKAANADEQK